MSNNDNVVNDETRLFQFNYENFDMLKAIANAYSAMIEKGYDPVLQFVGYLLSGEPTYITSHNNARDQIRKVGRNDLLEEIVRAYFKQFENK